MKKLFSFLLVAFFVISCFGKENEKSLIEKKRSEFIALPVIFYTPETKLAGGAAINSYFRESGSASNSKPSIILSSITYTQQKQMMAELVADLYWQNETYHILGYMGYKKFPDKFFGIGNNTPENNEESYTPRSAKFYFSVQKKIGAQWNAGIQFEFEQSKLIQIEKDGLLAQRNIPGSKGGTISGSGFLLNRDSRDNILYPTSGSYCQFSVNFFNNALGSDYDFKGYSVDFRQYFSVSSSHVVAVQSYLNMQTGEPPFQKLSMLSDRVGGSNLMRGYYQGRYRDKNMMAFQIEYRILPVWWRFGLAAFAGMGDVSDSLANFELRKFKYSIGGGVRFLVNQNEKLNIRLDFAYGNNSSGMYITIGEAF